MSAAEPTVQLPTKVLTLKSVYGVNTKVRNNIHYVDEQNLAYPAGRTIVLYNTSGGQTFIKGSKESTGITAMAVSPNRKSIAVAERTIAAPTITIYETANKKRKKVISGTDANSHDFVNFVFSSDSKMILALGGSPSYKLYLWSLEPKPKLITVGLTLTDGNPVYQCSLSPDGKMICVTGNTIFKIFRIEDNEIRLVQNSLGKRDNEEYLAHTWIDDNRIVVANKQAHLLIVENMELKTVLPSSPADGLGIRTIVPYARGFVCGGDNGVVMIYEPDDLEVFKRYKTLKISHTTFEINDQEIEDTEDSHQILSFGLSPSSEMLAITTNTSQIFALNLTSSDILTQEQDIKFYFLTTPFHSQRVYGLDTCIRKPIIVTCSSDKTIRIWNYQDNTLMAVKKFPHEIYSVALHPNGLHVVVGFQDKLRFMNILGNDIREARSFPVRNCPEVKFSHGGQFFAAVHGNMINVYSTYLLQQIHSLRGHSGKIRCLLWNDDDSRLISTGMDGAVYEYIVRSEKRIAHHFNKSSEYTGVARDGKTFYVAGTDKMVREFIDSGSVGEFPLETAMYSLAVAKGQKLMFGGMADGSIRVSGVPSINSVVEQINCHGDTITRICLIHDETLLITVSEEGVMCIFEIRDREGTRIKRDTRYSEEILIAAADLEDKNNTIAELKAKVAELRSDNEYDQKKKDIEFNERLRDQSSNYTEEIRKKDEKISQMREIIEQTKQEMEQKVEELAEEHLLELSKKDKDCQDKISGFLQQIQILKTEFNMERDELLEKIKDQEEQYQAEMAKLIETHTEDLSAERLKYESLKAEFEKSESDYIERLAKIDEEREKEIYKLKYDFAEKANHLQRTIQELSKNRKDAVADRDRMNTQLQQIMKEVKVKEQKLKDLKDKKNHFEQEVVILKNDNREREETIIDKEKKILDLKRQNQDLEKFKFVLQYKITTLEEEIRPNKNQISTLNTEMKQMRQELDRFKEINEEQNRAVEELKLQLTAKTNELQRLNEKLKDGEAYKARIRSEIHEVAQTLEEPKKLKEEIKNLYHRHVSGSIKQNEIEYDLQKDHDRQRVYLEKTIDSLKKKLVKAQETAKIEINRVIHENMELIKEINVLRKDVRILSSKLKEREDAKSKQLDNLSTLSSPLNIVANDITSIEEAWRVIEAQRTQIRILRDRLDELEAERRARSRPISREKLPPMEGFQDQN